MAANECDFVPQHLPSRWNFVNFAKCNEFKGEPSIGMMTIFFAVIIEASLWGLGTAIGELPPYFVSRAASIAGGKS
jgi:hypothetical protein